MNLKTTYNIHENTRVTCICVKGNVVNIYSYRQSIVNGILKFSTNINLTEFFIRYLIKKRLFEFYYTYQCC